MRTDRAFTLVEILVVIAIIGILVSLVVVAVSGAMRQAKRGRIAMEMSQIAMALERYKAEFGEYPPDMFDDEALVRHVKKRWPRFELHGSEPYEQAQNIRYTIACVYMNADIYTEPLQTEWLGNDSYDIFIAEPLGSLTSLCFWLGGFPDKEGNFVGFDADPEAPLGRFENGTGVPNNGDPSAGNWESVAIGTPDKKVFLELTVNKNVYFTGVGESSYMVPCIVNRISSDTVVPYVYFRGRADGGAEAYGDFSNPGPGVKHFDFANIQAGYVPDGPRDVSGWRDIGVAVPYAMRGSDSSNVVWYESSKYQLIHPGLDGKFGEGTGLRIINLGTGIGAQDLDNLTNFSDYKELKSILP